jgi:hypothetical protein
MTKLSQLAKSEGGKVLATALAAPKPWEDPGFVDRYMFDEELDPIDRMARSTRRIAINKRGYPKPRRIGLRSAWLLSEVLAWMKAKPYADEQPTTPRKALGEGIKQMRAKHGQRVAEAGAGEVA